jgi:hypothetical protein
MQKLPIIVVFIIVCSITNSVFSMEECGDIWPPESSPGMSCGDGVVDLFDYHEAIDIHLGLVTPTPCQLQQGDVPNGKPPNCSECEGNGIINLSDALVIDEKVAGVDNCCNYCFDGDLDHDAIPDDGDGNGTPGDNPCTGGETYNCDDNCPVDSNPNQEDNYPPGGNGRGDACDCNGNFDCDEDIDGTDALTFSLDFGRSQYHNPCESGNPCNGDFDCDNDCDSSDAFLFKADFGRGESNNPCPSCVVEPWCAYP